jgi:hypothetical protein
MLFTYTVERRSGSQGAVYLPFGQQWWLTKCCMHALRRKVVAPRMVYSCTIEMSGGCQDAVCTHYGEECWQPVCYVYALRTGVAVARMVHKFVRTHAHTHTHTHTHTVDRSGGCQNAIAHTVECGGGHKHAVLMQCEYEWWLSGCHTHALGRNGGSQHVYLFNHLFLCINSEIHGCRMCQHI